MSTTPGLLAQDVGFHTDARWAPGSSWHSHNGEGSASQLHQSPGVCLHLILFVCSRRGVWLRVNARTKMGCGEGTRVDLVHVLRVCVRAGSHYTSMHAWHILQYLSCKRVSVDQRTNNTHTHAHAPRVCVHIPTHLHLPIVLAMCVSVFRCVSYVYSFPDEFMRPDPYLRPDTMCIQALDPEEERKRKRSTAVKHTHTTRARTHSQTQTYTHTLSLCLSLSLYTHTRAHANTQSLAGSRTHSSHTYMRNVFRCI